MKAINDIFPLLDKPIKIVITTHQKPDADAMGSSLGLYHFLVQFGHDVTVISPTNWAEWLKWMKGAENVIDYELNVDKSVCLLKEADWIFCLDFNTLERSRKMAPVISGLPTTKI